MKTYLIDFENVHDLGMNGIHNLSDEDHVYIFYTSNAEKISLDWFNNVCAVTSSIKVNCGPQSLDKHLLSFLGYLIGQESSITDQYIIISKDRGYESIAQFWCMWYGDELKVSVQQSISGKAINCITTKSQHEVLLSRIQSIIRKHGEYTEVGKAITLSNLCTYLNEEPSFQKERERLKLKGMKLVETCSEVVRIVKRNHAEWAVLLNNDELVKYINEAGNDSEKEQVGAEIVESSATYNEDHPFQTNCDIGDVLLDGFPLDDEESDEPVSFQEKLATDAADSESNTEMPSNCELAYNAAIEKGYDAEIAEAIAEMLKPDANGAVQPRVIIYRSFLKKFGKVKGNEYYGVVKNLEF